MAEDSCNANGSAAEVIFNEALRRPADERGEYLTQVCGDDSRLRARVEALLRAAEAPEGFLPEAPGAGPRLDLSGAGTGAVPIEEKAGDTIGRYRLVQQIGEGGFGVVYLAEQSEPVKRRVALKIIKLGMDTRQVVARFEAERQALALMDHPNIAKILDAGATDTGRPYFVMELVEGIKITDYCEKERLPTSERLNLFIQVCRAIQHAHQKGIIHRDIKPSNVLVTLQDGIAVPKVIDFGIAKATQKELAEQTAFTQLRQFVGTPAYMSPEQADLSGLDVDTRSDIYSLGALLYELLTGKTPFETKELLAAGLEEMRRAIREKEPPTPSARLQQELSAEPSPSARGRISKFSKDLDWIVMKCLEKDRRRRYETVNGLAMDIQRHLNNEPVVAGPPTKLYRLQKLVRRNKLVFGAGAALAGVLVVGVLVSTVEAVQARRAEANEAHQRDKAQIEAAKSQQVAQLLQEMLQSVGPSVAKGRDVTMLKDILDKTAQRVGKELTNQPEVEIELRDVLATTYYQLGQFKQMEDMQRENLRLARSQSPLGSSAVARALDQIAVAQWCLASYAPAEKAARESLAMRRKLSGEGSSEEANSLNTLGLVLRAQGRLTEAETTFRQALVITRKTSGTNNVEVAMVLANLADAILLQTDTIVPGQAGPGGSDARLAEAEGLLKESLAIRRRELGNDNLDTIMSVQFLADVLEKQTREQEAEAMQREALAMRRKLQGNEHPDVAVSLNNLATVLFHQEKWVEAEGLYREALALNRKLFPDDHPELANVLGNLANVLNKQGKLAESEQAYREALAILIKTVSEDHPGLATARYNLACTLSCEGKSAEAEVMFRQAMPALSKVFGAESPRVATLLNHLGEALRKQGKLTEAETTYREALVMERKILGAQHPYLADTTDSLAAVLDEEGKLEEVETLYRDQAAALRAVTSRDDPNLASLLAQVTSRLLAQAKFTNAEPLARECLAIREKKLPDDWRTFNTRSMLGASLLGQQRYTEAEPLLVSGYEGMNQRESQIPVAGKLNLNEALERLVQLYEATHQPEQVAVWKQKLAEFEQAQTNQPPTAGGLEGPSPVPRPPKQ